MKLRAACVVVGFVSLVFSMAAQTLTSSSGSAQVPQLIQFSSVATDDGGNSLSGVVSVTFSLYSNQQAGEPLWTETQGNVQLDPTGHYSVQLGVTKPAGVPTTLFTSGEARWLGVRIDEQAEKPRVLLVSVPYALKAGDAATIGGLPPSAFALASSLGGANITAPLNVAATLSGGGTKDYVPLWLSSTALGNSKLFQSSAGNVGVGTKTPVATLDVKGAVNAATSYNLGGTAFAYGSYANQSAFLGFAGNSTTSGTGITATGVGALQANTTGYGNTACGAYALYHNTTASENTACGYEALYSNTVETGNQAQDNTAYGYQALYSNTYGIENTASGAYALYSNTGNDNTAIGYTALRSNTTGNGNVAIGIVAMSENTTGGANTATGGAAMYYNTTGNNNTASGSTALYSNTAGNNNTASGFEALNSTQGSDNTASGAYALNSNSASGSTADGYQALGTSTTGQYNAAFGYMAGYNVTTGSNNIEIGNQGTASDSGAIRIGAAGTQTSAFIAGIYGTKTSANNAVPVLIDSNGNLGTISSSRRYKEDIQDMGDASAGLMRLRPVTFRYKNPFADGSKPMQYGLIAEEVAEVYPDLVARSGDGQIETVKYQLLDPMLLNEVQKQQAEIRELQERLSKMEAALAAVSHAGESR